MKFNKPPAYFAPFLPGLSFGQSEDYKYLPEARVH